LPYPSEPTDGTLPAEEITPRERATLLASVLIISVCALTYELIIATLSSYLLGDSITQFSFTIGFFLFAMGLGSLLSRALHGNELRYFIIVELLTGLFGGLSAFTLYAVFSLVGDFYYPAMIGIIIAVGTCIGLEIPLLTRIVANRSDLRRALADILSVDYLGSLLASLAFPIILLPLLGVTLTAFLMGLFNVVAAGLVLSLFSYRLPRAWVRSTWVAVGGVGALMLVGAVMSADVVRILEQRLYNATIVFREQTSYQRLVLTRGGGDDIRLFIDGNLQFSSRDEYRYHEMLIHPPMAAARSREHVLVLGGGDGLVARELLKYDDVEQITVVDLDPAMTNFARTNPMMLSVNEGALDDPRVTVVNEDAFRFLEGTNTLYSVIIADLPDPNSETLAKLYSVPFYRLVRNNMARDGIFMTQASSPYFVRQAFWTIANTVEAADFKVVPLRTHVPSFGEWGFVMASPVATPPVRTPEGVEMRWLTPELLDTALLFDADTSRVETEINTLNNPVLHRVYNDGWQQW
ncbi:MAG: polyamine aminopropyltransferase, partial [Chloroflexota bacterium]